MSEKLPDISPLALGVHKQRAVLRMVALLQDAYAIASKRYGMSRKDFAQRIGMKPSQFSRILNGRQNVSVEIAEAVLRAMEARTEFGFSFLEDLSREPTNRVSSSAFRKTDNGGAGRAIGRYRVMEIDE